MTTKPTKSRRAEFWTVFILISGICFALAISGSARRYNAGKTVEILRPLIAADPRFSRVKVSYGTNGRAYLTGRVNSAEDLEAFRELVRQARLPSQPSIDVRVEPPVPNQSWQPTRGGRLLCFQTPSGRRGCTLRSVLHNVYVHTFEFKELGSVTGMGK